MEYADSAFYDRCAAAVEKSEFYAYRRNPTAFYPNFENFEKDFVSVNMFLLKRLNIFLLNMFFVEPIFCESKHSLTLMQKFLVFPVFVNKQISAVD